MSKRQRTKCLALAGAALALLAGALSNGHNVWAQAADPDPCIAGQPCFTTVTDILNGRRHLLRTDDLVIAGAWSGQDDTTTYAGVIQHTLNSGYSDARPSIFSGLVPAGGRVTALTVVRARMFNTAHDQAVSAKCDVDTSSGCDLTVYADPNNIRSALGGAAIDPTSVLWSAAADFTGDSYDEVVLIGNEAGIFDSLAVEIVTAANPDDPSAGLRLISSYTSGINRTDVTPDAIAVGDFFGTGHPAIAIEGTAPPSLCGSETGCHAIEFFTVDPGSL
jgi:hypothetical protein